ncbi:MAG: transposase family protein [Planctomycetaceae bacterium]
MTSPALGLFEFLKQVPDPRGRKGRRHTLSAMLATVVCSVLCGARGFEANAQWIHVQEREFHHLLGYTRGPPTKNAFRGLLAILDAELFEPVLVDWTTTIRR